MDELKDRDTTERIVTTSPTPELAMKFRLSILQVDVSESVENLMVTHSAPTNNS